MYFLLAASLYFVDSVHIAVILLQLNMLEFSLAIKIKQLDDALEKTVDHLSAMHMELAMLVCPAVKNMALNNIDSCPGLSFLD